VSTEQYLLPAEQQESKQQQHLVTGPPIRINYSSTTADHSQAKSQALGCCQPFWAAGQIAQTHASFDLCLDASLVAHNNFSSIAAEVFWLRESSRDDVNVKFLLITSHWGKKQLQQMM
jgi:hypothetical protein